MTKEKQIVEKFVSMIEDFVNKKTNGEEFGDKYRDFWRDTGKIELNGRIRAILDTLHGDEDFFVSDPEALEDLRSGSPPFSEYHLDEKEFRELATLKLRRLKEIMKSENWWEMDKSDDKHREEGDRIEKEFRTWFENAKKLREKAKE